MKTHLLRDKKEKLPTKFFYICGMRIPDNTMARHLSMSVLDLLKPAPRVAMQYVESVSCLRCRKTSFYKELHRNTLLEVELTEGK